MEDFVSGYETDSLRHLVGQSTVPLITKYVKLLGFTDELPYCIAELFKGHSN